jgi:hypothetical protein
MVETRLYAAIGLVLLVLLPCSFVGVREIAQSANAHDRVVGELIGEFKREHDEAELREVRERAPQTPEERQEAHEQAEQTAIRAAQAREGEER